MDAAGLLRLSVRREAHGGAREETETSGGCATSVPAPDCNPTSKAEPGPPAQPFLKSWPTELVGRNEGASVLSH